ncbi:MAG TPA: glycerophosphodiester phosphodiesterase [Candidatus Babeliales bacterium]|nr:glycerophosphodiester phosphodiesterase [Candidatus Babeliales bacterium]
MKKLFAGALLVYSLASLAVSIIGHRGAAGYAPENTLTSFAKAIECNVDMIEFDVWKCASGELVVFHDAKLNALTNGYGYITEKRLDELQKLSVLGCERIPTLLEVLDFVNQRVKVYIEIKDPAIAQDIVSVIEHYVNVKHWQYDDFLVASFDHIQLRNIKAANSLIAVAALFYGIPIDVAALAVAIDARVVCLSIDFINQSIVDAIHNCGMLVYVYTVNDHDDSMRVLSYGIDGIITDYP